MDQTNGAPFSTRPSRVCDDSEVRQSQRWPLHPRPMRFETLDTYVRRLAERYEIGLRTFYRHGLGCEPEDLPALADDPPRWALERLSAGTGLSIRELRNMTNQRSYARIAIALRNLGRDRPQGVLTILEDGFRRDQKARSAS